MMGDQHKREVIIEMITQKRLDIVFQQETHSEMYNERDSGLWWRCQNIRSQGIHFSAGVAIIFSSGIDIKIMSPKW